MAPLYVQLQDTYEGLLRKKGYREQYDKSEVVLKEAENRLDIHVETARPEPADEEAPASESESEDEFEQQLARARHAGITAAARKKAKAKAKQDQQAGTTTAKKPISKLDRFQQKKIGYEMSISALQRTLAVQVKKAFELFEFILGEDASERWREIVIRICDDG